MISQPGGRLQRWLAAIPLTVLAVIPFALSTGTSSGAQRTTRSAVVNSKVRTSEAGSIGQFKEAFQNDAGKVRLVALVSPT